MAALKIPTMLPPAVAAAAAAAMDRRQAQMELDEREGCSYASAKVGNMLPSEEEVFEAVPFFPCIMQPCVCFPSFPPLLTLPE